MLTEFEKQAWGVSRRQRRARARERLRALEVTLTSPASIEEEDEKKREQRMKAVTKSDRGRAVDETYMQSGRYLLLIVAKSPRPRATRLFSFWRLS